MKIIQENSFKHIVSSISMLACILLLSTCGSGGSSGPSFDSEGTEDNPVILSLNTLKQGYSGTVGKKGSKSYYRVEDLMPNLEVEHDLYAYIFVVNNISGKDGVGMLIPDICKHGGGGWRGATDMHCPVFVDDDEAVNLDITIINDFTARGAEYVLGMRNPAPSEFVDLSKAEAIAGHEGFTGDPRSVYTIEGLGTNKNYEIAITNVKNIGNGKNGDIEVCISGIVDPTDSENIQLSNMCWEIGLKTKIKTKWACNHWDYDYSEDECGSYSDTLSIDIQSSESALAEIGYEGHSYTLKIKEL